MNATLTRSRLPRKYRRPLRQIWDWTKGIAFILALCAAIVFAAGTAYKIKRHYHINVFQGIDMLPDNLIEKYIW